MSNKDEMRAEYDLRGKKGVRGKYNGAMKNAYTTIVHKSDGSTVITETYRARARCAKIFP